MAHAVVQFCGCEAKLLSWHWSKRLVRFDSLHVSVWIVPGSNDQMIKWLRWLSMSSHPTFVRWNQKPRSAYLESSDTSKSCSQNWSSSGILKCGFSYIEKWHLAGKLSKASNSLTWLVSEWHAMNQLDMKKNRNVPTEFMLSHLCWGQALCWTKVMMQTRTRLGTEIEACVVT